MAATLDELAGAKGRWSRMLPLMGLMDAVAARVAAGEAVQLQIGNNHGRINGWTSHARVYGICTTVEGVPRPHVTPKLKPLS